MLGNFLVFNFLELYAWNSMTEQQRQALLPDVDMEFDRILISVIFCLVSISIFNSGSSTPFLVFSVINAIIVSILVQSHRPSSAEVDRVLNFLPSLFEGGGDTQDGSLEYDAGDEHDDGDDKYCNSHVQIKDDNAGEVTTQDEQESDENLKRRIENFIANVNKGWIEESRRDNYDLDTWIG